MSRLQKIWQRITTSRYTRALEASARLESVLREELARERAENQRLRAENRALLNSILGIAGVPPLPAVAPPPPLAPVGAQHAAPAAALSESRNDRGAHVTQALQDFDAPPSTQDFNASGNSVPNGETSPSNCAGRPPRRTAPEREGDARSSSPKQNGIAAIPMRRRSWQQINRMLEFESTKKKESTVTS